VTWKWKKKGRGATCYAVQITNYRPRKKKLHVRFISTQISVSRISVKAGNILQLTVQTKIWACDKIIPNNNMHAKIYWSNAQFYGDVCIYGSVLLLHIIIIVLLGCGVDVWWLNEIKRISYMQQIKCFIFAIIK
jgi:hypothetical protein